jgi:regulatory protein YycH of two-component signal transduction system YycFG
MTTEQTIILTILIIIALILIYMIYNIQPQLAPPGMYNQSTGVITPLVNPIAQNTEPVGFLPLSEDPLFGYTCNAGQIAANAAFQTW